LLVCQLGLALACSVVATTAGLAPSAALDRFIARQDEPLREYRAFRRLRAESERFAKRATLDAWTELRGDGTFRFFIVREEGAESVRHRVLRAALHAEARAFAEDGTERSRLVPSNYEFGAAESLAGGLFRVPIKPRRSDALLLNGAAVFSADGDLVRLEGQPAKKPSFWISRLQLVREYERIAGVRVPVRVTSSASLRFVGPGSFQMTYEYTSINGRPLVVRAGP
jgi:hypothetical protein